MRWQKGWLSKEQLKWARKNCKESIPDKIMVSEKYEVFITECPPEPGWPCPMIHLSIKRHDRQPIHDWRDLQEIKTDLVGARNEGVELYPAEDRVIDAANQFHLWVMKDPEIRFPFGFHEGRHVGTCEAAEAMGARQRRPK